MNNKNFELLADYYEFTMAQTFYHNNQQDNIVYYDVFTRSHPDNNGYLIFNGLERVIKNILDFKFEKEHIDFLRKSGLKDEGFLQYLLDMKLELDIWAVPEGSVVFKNEPFLTIRGPIIQAQIIETLVLLSVNYSTLVTTKASRIVNAAQGKAIMEFGARRAQGYDASLEGARCAVIAGCIGTSNTLAGFEFDLPVSGTIAHSYVQMHDTEYEAFMNYAKVNPENCVLLVDTYNTLKSGMPNAIKVAKEYLIPNGYQLKAIRLDSGDLAYLSKKCRQMLDDAGLFDTLITASNSLNEYVISDLLNQDAKIDSFGVGENLITAKSDAVLGGVYKMVAIEKNDQIKPLIKVSESLEKITNPGYKKLYRVYDKDTHKALADYIALHDEDVPTDSLYLFDELQPWKEKTVTNYYLKELQVPIFVKGKLVYDLPNQHQIKEYCKQELDSLWDEVKRMVNPHKYYVDLSPKLYELKQSLIQKHKEVTKKES